MNINEISTPEDLNKELNTWDKGTIFNNGEKVLGDDMYKMEYAGRYRSIPVKDAIENRIGDCWTFVSVENDWFKKHMPNTEIHCYFIRSEFSNPLNSVGSTGTAHTVLLFRGEDNNLYYFESSWRKHVGIFKVNSVKDVIDYYINDHCQNGNECLWYKIYEFDITGMDNKLTQPEFWKIAMKNGPIYEYNKYDNILKESSNVIDSILSPEELYKFLSTFEYGFVDNHGKKYIAYNGVSVDWNKYNTMPIKVLEHQRIGVCWDLSNYEANWFEKHNKDYDYHIYYAIMDRNGDNTNPDVVTHTWVIYSPKNKKEYYWIECSWEENKGIHYLGKNINEAWKTVVKLLFKRYEPKYYIVYDFNYNLALSDWMSVKVYNDYIEHNSKKIAGNIKGNCNKPLQESSSEESVLELKYPLYLGEAEKHSDEFNQIVDIMKSLNKQDYYMFRGDRPIDTYKDIPVRTKVVKGESSTVFREVLKQNGGAGFIECYQYPESTNTAVVAIAVNTKAQGTGLSDQLVQDALKGMPKYIKYVLWCCDKENKYSRNLALRNGFVPFKRKSQDEDSFIYTRKEKDLVQVEAVIQSFDTPNKNGRIYTSSNLVDWRTKMIKKYNSNPITYIPIKEDSSYTYDIDIDKSKTQIMQSFGVYDKENHNWNACVKVNTLNCILRHRAEILIFDKDKVLITYKKNNAGIYTIELPGGSLNKGETGAKAAQREAQEEAKIKSKNITYVDFRITMWNEIPDWVKENIPKEDWWEGHYSEVYYGIYNGEYDGKIASEDIDTDILNSAEFLPISQVYDTLCPEYKKACDMYLSHYKSLNESSTLHRATFGLKIKPHQDLVTSFKLHRYQGYLDFINSLDDPDDLKYMRQDINMGLNQFDLIAERIDKCQKLGLCKETKKYYDGIYKMYISKGVTSKDVMAYKKFLTNECAPAVAKRLKEIKKKENKAMNENSLLSAMEVEDTRPKITMPRESSVEFFERCNSLSLDEKCSIVETHNLLTEDWSKIPKDVFLDENMLSTFIPSHEDIIREVSSMNTRDFMNMVNENYSLLESYFDDLKIKKGDLSDKYKVKAICDRINRESFDPSTKDQMLNTLFISLLAGLMAGSMTASLEGIFYAAALGPFTIPFIGGGVLLTVVSFLILGKASARKQNLIEKIDKAEAKVNDNIAKAEAKGDKDLVKAYKNNLKQLEESKAYIKKHLRDEIESGDPRYRNKYM